MPPDNNTSHHRQFQRVTVILWTVGGRALLDITWLRGLRKHAQAPHQELHSCPAGSKDSHVLIYY